MQLYVTEETLKAQQQYADHWIPVYLKAEVDAALAEKDARIAELEFRLRTVLELHQAKVEANPDTARLDWLNSNCTLMPTENGQRWVVHTSSFIDNECLRTAIDQTIADAHQEPKS